MPFPYQAPTAKPEPSAGLFTDPINEGLIGIWRPEVLYQNLSRIDRPWSFADADALPYPRVIADPLGQFGRVWSFDGQNDSWVRVDDPINNPRKIYQPDNITVAGWGRFRNVPAEPRGGFCMQTYQFGSDGWGMYVQEAGAQWKFRTYVEFWNLPEAAESQQFVTLNRWYHWAFTFNGPTGDILQYIDGELDGVSLGLTIERSNVESQVTIGTARESTTPRRSMVGEIAEIRIFDRVKTPAEIRMLYEAPKRHEHLYVPNLFFQPDEGAPLFNLDIDGLLHDHPIDQVDLNVLSYDLPIEDLLHVRPVDAPVITPNYTLFAANLLHARPVDELQLEITTDLLIADLTHEVPIDQVDILATTATLLSIDELDHARALDVLLLEPTHNLLVDGLDHARFLEEANVQVLLGDATELRATAVDWRMDAGQTLITTAGADQNWHVIDCVFDGVNSEIRVDNGPPVVGDAGVRALELLSLGADVDGEHRATGYIAEFRIYNNNIPLNFRQNIADTLIKKWIQP